MMMRSFSAILLLLMLSTTTLITGSTIKKVRKSLNGMYQHMCGLDYPEGNSLTVLDGQLALVESFVVMDRQGLFAHAEAMELLPQCAHDRPTLNLRCVRRDIKRGAVPLETILAIASKQREALARANVLVERELMPWLQALWDRVETVGDEQLEYARQGFIANIPASLDQCSESSLWKRMMRLESSMKILHRFMRGVWNWHFPSDPMGNNLVGDFFFPYHRKMASSLQCLSQRVLMMDSHPTLLLFEKAAIRRPGWYQQVLAHVPAFEQATLASYRQRVSDVQEAGMELVRFRVIKDDQGGQRLTPIEGTDLENFLKMALFLQIFGYNEFPIKVCCEIKGVYGAHSP